MPLVSPDWSNILAALKPSGWHYLAVAVASAVLLFAPESFLGVLGVREFVASQRQWVGLALLASLPLALFSGIKWRVEEATRKRRKEEEERDRIREEARREEERLDQLEGVLRNLGDDEWDVVNDFLDANAGTRRYRIEHGAVQGLVAKGVLFRPHQMTTDPRHLNYGMNTWVSEMLRKKPHLQRRRS